MVFHQTWLERVNRNFAADGSLTFPEGLIALERGGCQNLAPWLSWGRVRVRPWAREGSSSVLAVHQWPWNYKPAKRNQLSGTAQKTPVHLLCQQPNFVFHVWKGFWGAASQWQVSVWVFLLRTLYRTSLHVALQLIFHLHPPVPGTFCLHWELIFARLMEPSWASRKRKKEEKGGRETPGEVEKEIESM